MEISRTEKKIPRCRRCPELREYCAEIARVKKRAYAGEDYWGKPVPGFGDPEARIWIIGLAPGAHGANRTGRMFTGDRSGDFLFAALHRAGLCNQKEACGRDDGLRLRDVYISAAIRCAPPANRPTAAQLANCTSYLDEEYIALKEARVLLCLGGIAWKACLALLTRQGVEIPRPKPKFGHGKTVFPGEKTVLGCYHVSQQNTFTGRLTSKMLDEVLRRAKLLADNPAV